MRLTESAMSELYTLAQESKTFAEFVKKFMGADISKTTMISAVDKKKLVQWLKEFWDDLQLHESIKQSQKSSLLKENPDVFRDSNEVVVSWRGSEKNIAFGYYRDKFYDSYTMTQEIQKKYPMHNGVRTHDGMGNFISAVLDREDPSFEDDPDYNNIDRSNLKFAGRIFPVVKVISFWDYPKTHHDLDKVIRDINNIGAPGVHVDGEWDVDLSIEHDEAYRDGGTKLVKASSYKTNKNPEKISAAKHIEFGKHGNVPSGVGSKFKFKNQQPGETIAQMRARTKQSEHTMKKSDLTRIIKEEIQRVLREESSTTFIDSLLEAIEPTVLKMIAMIEKHYVKENRKFTDFDRKYARLGVTYDLLNAVERYTLPTDKLVDIKASFSMKGNVKIAAKVEREGTMYSFETDAIIAGGYNIQRLHFRYLIKTNLPKTNNNAVSQQYSAELKKLMKLETINKKINEYEDEIKMYQSMIDNAKSLSDEEIYAKVLAGENVMKKPLAPPPSWEEIVKRGADKNYNFSQKEYEKKCCGG